MHGRQNRWKIHAYAYGKYGSHLCVTAECVSGPTKSHELASGKRSHVRETSTFTAQPGTVLWQILAQAVADGSAEVV